MMTIRHHFKIFSLTLLISSCSTQVVDEVVNETINTTSTTIEVVQEQEDIISSTTTTTIPPTQVIEKTYEKALLGELSEGDCFDTNKHDLLAFDQSVIKKPCFEPHTYEVVFKNPDDRQSSVEGVFLNASVSDLQLLDLERAKICNEYASLVEITEYIEFSSMITLLDEARAIAPPDPPSPIIIEILGTVKDIQHSIEFAMAEACPLCSAPIPG